MTEADLETMLRPFLVSPCAIPPCSGISCDSRRVRPGDIFAAIPGVNDDGKRYAEAARAVGAVAVMGEPGEGVDIPVTDVRRTLGLAAAALNGNPSQALCVAGITGTNGKTTTAWLLESMLAQGGLLPGLLTTVENRWPGYSESADRTTPDACTLQSFFRQMVTAGSRAAVIEVSSHALDQQRTAGTRFTVCGFTNFTQDHLDYHQTMEAYFQAKKRLFLENPEATAVINIDNSWGQRLLHELKETRIKTVTYGFGEDADYHANSLSMTAAGNVFTLHFPEGHFWSLRTRLPGRHNIANMLCAAAMAHQIGVWREVIVTALTEACPCWGRLERISLPPGAPAVFVDYAHTDDALSNVLSALRELTQGELWCVFGCGGNRDRSKRPKMGLAAARNADRLVLTSDNPRDEAPLAIIAEVKTGIPEPTDCTVEPDRKVAIHLALRTAKAEDTVLIAGKGHETYQEIAGIRHPFNDAEIVRQFYETND